MRSIRSALPAAVVALCTVAGCVDLAPAHRTPPPPIPDSWIGRGSEPEREVRGDRTGPAPTVAGLAALVEPHEFVADPRLRRVVDRALVSNRDLRIAVADIERARAAMRLARAGERPRVDLTGSGVRGRSDGLTTTVYAAGVDVAYELDFFGRVRNLDAAATASYLAAVENRRSVAIALVSDVAAAWLALAADRESLALSTQTLTSRERSLDLTRQVHALGKFTGLDVAQVESTVEAARLQRAVDETRVAQDRNALELLIGGVLPADDEPVDLPADASALLDVPADLPSSVLTRRPDVQASERAIDASDANIGVARAAFFPSIALTGSAGLSSTALSQLIGRGAAAWTIGPTLALPIFDGGIHRANLDRARADRDVAVANYEKTLQVAFREVADVLAARRTLTTRLTAQRAFAASVATSRRLAEAVFRQGGSDYLSVLTAEQSLFGAQQALIALRLEEETSRVALYKAFGGAWRAEPVE